MTLENQTVDTAIIEIQALADNLDSIILPSIQGGQGSQERVMGSMIAFDRSAILLFFNKNIEP